MKKVAFVIHRCGENITGGAETHCLQLAKKMSKHWNVVILTTCASDYNSWENEFSPGACEIDHVPAIRFSVNFKRDSKKFTKQSLKVLPNKNNNDLGSEDEWMKIQGPYSVDLIDHIKTHSDNYDCFLFYCYLYATSYYCLPLVKEKSILMPLAHDEHAIYLRIFDVFFTHPKAFIFNTPEEKNFLKRRFPWVDFIGDSIAIGIDLQNRNIPNNNCFRLKYGIKKPYIIYSGRIVETKGCDELLEFYQKLSPKIRTNLDLVLTGKAIMEIPKTEGIHYLGFLDEKDKIAAMANAEWLIVPSIYESLSIVLLEGWLNKTPAIVHSDCEVTVGHCKRSNGGLWYKSFEEFQSLLNDVGAEQKLIMGQNGEKYVEKNYKWDVIENKMIALMELFER